MCEDQGRFLIRSENHIFKFVSPNNEYKQCPLKMHKDFSHFESVFDTAIDGFKMSH